MNGLMDVLRWVLNSLLIIRLCSSRVNMPRHRSGPTCEIGEFYVCNIFRHWQQFFLNFNRHNYTIGKCIMSTYFSVTALVCELCIINRTQICVICKPDLFIWDCCALYYCWLSNQHFTQVPTLFHLVSLC